MRQLMFASRFFILITVLGVYTSSTGQDRLWATYYGGTKYEVSQAVAVDKWGNVYMTGKTASDSSNTALASGGFQNTYGGGIMDAFLVKFDSSGNRLWATFYGGAGSETGYNVALDTQGNIYIVGETSSSGLAYNGFQDTFAGGIDAFLVKFDSAGNRLWSTYYGGTGLDYGLGVTIDPYGFVYMSGFTSSTSGIASGGFQDTIGVGTDAFLVKFDAAGNRLWATYYGGGSSDRSHNVATDAIGNVYMEGHAFSSSGIASGGHQDTFGGYRDVFLVKFDSAGNRLWATYYGGNNDERGGNVLIDPSGNVYLIGLTYSSNAISHNGHQNTFGGYNDGFVVKFDSSGNRLWATYYGGTGTETCTTGTVDKHANIYLTGLTQSTSGIASGGFLNTPAGQSDMFLVKFDSSGNREWGTYYGGGAYDEGFGLATDAWRNVYAVGASSNSSGIASGGFQNTFGGGGYDGFLIKFKTCTNSYSTLHPVSCNSYTSPSGKSIWVTNGTYYDTVASSSGCDILYTIHLQIRNATFSTIQPVACNGYTSPSGKYTWTTSGTYIDTLSNTLGCDSVITVQLVVIDSSSSVIGLVACDSLVSPSGKYIWTTSGTWYDTIPNAMGCDSMIMVQLVINQTSTSTIQPKACSNYTSPSGKYNWTSSNTYYDTIPNTLGCDSIITIQLTIHGLPQVNFSINKDTQCFQGHGFVFTNLTSGAGEYAWDFGDGTADTGVSPSKTYVNAGTYLVKLIATSAMGCMDSTWKNLLLNESPLAQINVIANDVCPYDTALLEVNNPQSNGRFQWLRDGNAHSADTAIQLFLPIAAEVRLVKTSENGCSDTSDPENVTFRNQPSKPSITRNSFTLDAGAGYAAYQWFGDGQQIQGGNARTYQITHNGSYFCVVGNSDSCFNVSDTISVSNVSVGDLESDRGIRVYPNPSKAFFTLSMESVVGEKTVLLYDAKGALLRKIITDESTVLMEIGKLASGIYLVKVVVKDSVYHTRLVKE